MLNLPFQKFIHQEEDDIVVVRAIDPPNGKRLVVDMMHIVLLYFIGAPANSCSPDDWTSSIMNHLSYHKSMISLSLLSSPSTSHTFILTLFIQH